VLVINSKAGVEIHRVGSQRAALPLHRESLMKGEGSFSHRIQSSFSSKLSQGLRAFCSAPTSTSAGAERFFLFYAGVTLDALSSPKRFVLSTKQCACTPLLRGRENSRAGGKTLTLGNLHESSWFFSQTKD